MKMVLVSLVLCGSLTGCLNLGLTLAESTVREHTGKSEPKSYSDYDTPSYCELHPESEDC